MKQIGLGCAIFAAILLGVSLHAGESSDFVMTAPSKVMLTYIDTNMASFTVHEPGEASGICGLILSSNSNHPDFYELTPLLARLEISTVTSSAPPIITPRFTRFSLLNKQIDPLYINILKIKTKDGKSISDNIKAVYKYKAPVWITVDFCN